MAVTMILKCCHKGLSVGDIRYPLGCPSHYRCRSLYFSIDFWSAAMLKSMFMLI